MKNLNSRTNDVELSKNHKEFKTLIQIENDLSIGLCSETALDAALRLVLDATCQIPEIDCGGVYLLNKETGGLDLIVHRGLGDDFIRETSHYDADSPNTGIVMRGTPVYGLYEEIEPMQNVACIKENLRVLAVIPLLNRKTIIGSLNAASHENDSLSESTKNILQTIASCAGSAIARIQAEYELEKYRTQLEKLVKHRTQALEEMNKRLKREISEHEKTENALRESEERYKTLVNTLPDAVTTTDLNGTILYASPQTVKLHGYTSPEELAGKNSFDLIDPKDRKKAENNLKVTLEKGVSSESEYMLLRKDGTSFPGEINATLIRDAASNPKEFVATTRDITRHKEYEENIRKSLEFEKTVSSISSYFIGTYDINRSIDYSLSDMGRLSGADRCYLFQFRDSGNVMDNTHEWCAPNVSPQMQILQNLPLSIFPWSMKKILKGKIVHIEDVSALPDEAKAERDILTKQDIKSLLLMPVTVGEGIGGFIGFDNITSPGRWLDRDITLLRIASEIIGSSLARKKTEDALRESEELYKSLIEASPDVVTLTDLDANIDFVSGKPLQSFGFPDLPSMVGKNAFDLLTADDRVKLREDLKKLLKDGSLLNEEYAIIGKNGEAYTAELNAVLVRDADGNPKSILSISRNVTQRKKAALEREALITQLEAKNAELERFAYTVSHDLKSPLITIRGFLRLIEKEIEIKNMEGAKSYIKRVSTTAGRMQHLLDRILELSRSGHMVDRIENIPLEQIIQDALAMLSGQIREHDITVEVADNLPGVQGERIRLIEVVENLLDNAVKFMGNQPKPKIEIGVRGMPSDTVFFVRDNGIGIEEQYREKIFDLFQKFTPETGAGAGLSIAKRIIESHGGRMWVESDGRNRGSTFCFTLPDRVIDQSDMNTGTAFSGR